MDKEQAGTSAFERYTELHLLEALEANPETTQADLATRAGVAVGTVNWYLKRWSAMGYVKMKRIGRWRWRYLLTPKGMSEKARLASKYVEASMRIYRRTREQAKDLLGQVREAGFKQVVINGDGDIAEIIELTCLEMEFQIIHDFNIDIPTIETDGLKLHIVWPDTNDLPK